MQSDDFSEHKNLRMQVGMANHDLVYSGTSDFLRVRLN